MGWSANRQLFLVILFEYRPCSHLECQFGEGVW